MAFFAPGAIEKGDVLTPTGMVKTLNSRFLEDVPRNLSTLLPLVSFFFPIADTPHQKERYHQAKGNAFLLPLGSQEAVRTPSILTRERLGVD